MGQNRPEAAAHVVPRPVTCGGQQGRMGLGLVGPVRCQSGLAGAATRHGVGTRPRHGHRAQGARGGTVGGVLPVAQVRRGWR
jgi:hypothetical protein